MLTEMKIFQILDRIFFFENVKRNRDLPNFAAKSNFYPKCWSKLRFSKSWTEIGIFSKMLTEVQIFEFLKGNRIFFENVDRNGDYRNFGPKLIFFQICWPKTRFSKFWTEIAIFSKMLIEIEIFQIFNRNRFFFSKMLTGIEIFEILKRNWIFFENVDRSPGFEILKGNRFFVENVDRNGDYRNFEPKSKYFQKCS